MKRIWLAWLVFGFCAGAVFAIMAWGSRTLMQLDASEKKARQEAALEENVRLSLWRMETALAAIVVEENSRPHGAYLRRGPPRAHVRAYFQIDGSVLRSGSHPPRGIEELRKPAALSALGAAIPRTWINIEQPPRPGVTPQIPPAPNPAAPQIRQAEPLQPGFEAQLRGALQSPSTQSQMARNSQEFEARGMLNGNNAFVLNQLATPPPERPRPIVEIRTGVLAPVWVGDDLILARHVQVGSRDILQGFVIDWLKVRSRLLASIADLLPGSDLIPERGPFDPAEGRTLASLPLRLVPGRVPGAVAEERSPLLLSLELAWVCIVVAIVSVGVLLMGTLTLSQRRAAFVSSVTHELRTPLTTFRMYSEMLVEGMATDPAKQSQYHQTLYRESTRLMHLVENVLSYARLEKGRYGDRETVSIGELLDRMRDRLAEHARLAGMQLVVTMDPNAAAEFVSVDSSAIERILFNLVDNACKYARSADDRRIHIAAESEGRRARITVRDHGPGMNGRGARRLFRPFRKTANEAARSAPGVGIGLPLSRRLASAAGGRLAVDGSSEGACLRLDLPLAAPRAARSAVRRS